MWIVCDLFHSISITILGVASQVDYLTVPCRQSFLEDIPWRRKSPLDCRISLTALRGTRSVRHSSHLCTLLWLSPDVAHSAGFYGKRRKSRSGVDHGCHQKPPKHPLSRHHLPFWFFTFYFSIVCQLGAWILCLLLILQMPSLACHVSDRDPVSGKPSYFQQQTLCVPYRVLGKTQFRLP